MLKLSKLFKRCFTCKIKYPVFLFHKNTTKHSIASDLGRTIECRICNVKRFIKQKGKVSEYNTATRKHSVQQYKVNLKNILKRFF